MAKCSVCGKEYTKRSGNQKTCSKECSLTRKRTRDRNRYREKYNTTTYTSCLICGNEIPSSRTKYCSTDCLKEAMKRKTLESRKRKKMNDFILASTKEIKQCQEEHGDCFTCTYEDCIFD